MLISGSGATIPYSSGTSFGDDKSKKPLPEPNGDYKVLKELGAGAFGCVYLCYDNATGRHFAMKRLHALENPEPGAETSTRKQVMQVYTLTAMKKRVSACYLPTYHAEEARVFQIQHLYLAFLLITL